MTADDKPPFAAKLRALSKDASPGPWEDSSFAPSLFDGAGDSVIHYSDEVGAYVHGDDAALIVALRNHADRLADLVERVAQYRGATREANKAPTLEAMGYALHRADVAKDAIFAALDALDGGGA